MFQSERDSGVSGWIDIANGAIMVDKTCFLVNPLILFIFRYFFILTHFFFVNFILFFCKRRFIRLWAARLNIFDRNNFFNGRVKLVNVNINIF